MVKDFCEKLSFYLMHFLIDLSFVFVPNLNANLTPSK